LYPALESKQSVSAAVCGTQTNKTKSAFSRALKLVKLTISLSAADSLFQSRRNSQIGMRKHS